MMNLNDALTLAMDGERMHGDHMAEGQYIEHVMSRGYVRCWPVDRPEDEPNRPQCDFLPNDRDRAAVWSILARPNIDSWGKPIDDVSRGLNHTLREMGPGIYSAQFDEVVMTAKGPVIKSLKNVVPWGGLKLNTPATSNTPEYISAVDKLIGAPASPWGAPVASDAPKRDGWGRPID